MKIKSYLILVGILGIVVICALFDLSILFPRSFKLGLDLQGGSHLVYQADLSKIDQNDWSSTMEGLRDVIERRVNLFGVGEPIVQTEKIANNWRLIVELPGVKNIDEAIKMIGQTPYLEFREPKPNYDELIEQNQDKIESGEMKIDELFQPTELNGRYLKRAEVKINPTKNIPSNTPAPPIETIPKDAFLIFGKFIKSAPISVPKTPEIKARGEAKEGINR